MKNVFPNEFLARRLARELHIIRHLNHANVICALDMHKMQNQDTVLVVTDLMSTDLAHVIPRIENN